MSEAALVVTSLLAAIAAGGGTSWFVFRAQRRNLDAQTSSTITADAMKLYEKYKDEVETARLEIVGLRSELEEQRRRRYELEHRVERLEMWILENTEWDPAWINGETA